MKKKRMKKVKFASAVWKEGRHYVAQCLNIDVASFGRTKDLALRNLKEALELYLEDIPKAKISKIQKASVQLQEIVYAA